MNKAKETLPKYGGGARQGRGGLCQNKRWQWMGSRRPLPRYKVAMNKAKKVSAKVKGGYGQGQGGLCQGNMEVGLFSMANKLFVIPDSSVTSGKIPWNWT
jgi:hypothetical protein